MYEDDNSKFENDKIEMWWKIFPDFAFLDTVLEAPLEFGTYCIQIKQKMT